MTQAKKMTAKYCVNERVSEEKITCEIYGEWGFIGAEKAGGNVWRDKNGNLWELWRFSRKYTFVPFKTERGPHKFWVREV